MACIILGQHQTSMIPKRSTTLASTAALSLSFLPYVIAAILLGELTDTWSYSFLKWLGILLVGRMVLGIVEFPPSMVLWRLKNRPLLIDSLVEYLTVNGFPTPNDRRDDYYYYVCEVAADENASRELRNAALLAEQLYGALETGGVLASFRISSATNEALKRFRQISIAAAAVTAEEAKKKVSQ